MTSFFGRIFKSTERELDRVLEQAYQASLKIKDIEDEYFNGNKIPIDSPGNSGSISSSLRAEIEKNLGAAQLKSSEFRAKYSGQGNLTSNQIVKLRFVDGILAKYSGQKSTSIVPLSASNNPGSQVKGQLSLTNQSPGKGDSLSQKSGMLPRSIGKTINKIKKDLDPNAEQEVLRDFRRTRAKTRTAVRFIALLIIIPIAVHYLTKIVFVQPAISALWEQQSEEKIFLHYEMKEKAFEKLSGFKEELEFENFLRPQGEKWSEEQIEERVKEEANEVAEEYREESISALSNVFADLLAVIAFAVVLLVSKREIVVLKSFIDSVVYGLSDSAKAFIIILSTDIFVGFHSPHGWDVIMEVMAEHLGVPANKMLISLFIATIPVFMDTLFKYWIFRYLSRMSPSTVATLKEMDD